jgi:hypothetical protein
MPLVVVLRHHVLPYGTHHGSGGSRFLGWSTFSELTDVGDRHDVGGGLWRVSEKELGLVAHVPRLLERLRAHWRSGRHVEQGGRAGVCRRRRFFSAVERKKKKKKTLINPPKKKKNKR